MKINYFGYLKRFMTISLFFCLVSCQPTQHYPSTYRSDVTDAFHGKTVHDPYRWLENLQSDSVKLWIDQQEKYYQGLLDEEALDYYTKRMMPYYNYAWHEPFRKYGGIYFYRLKKPGENEDKIYTRLHPSDEEKLDFDPKKELAESDNFLGVFKPSHDAKFIAMYTNKTASSWHTLRIKDREKNVMLPEKIEGLRMLNFYSNIIWDKSNRGFYYVQFDPPNAENMVTKKLQNPRIKYHQLRTNPKQDPIIFKLPNTTNHLYYANMTSDKNELIVRVKSQAGKENEFYRVNIKDGRSTKTEKLVSKNGTYIYVGNNETSYWFRTNINASNYTVKQIDRKSGNESVLIPETDLPIRNVNIVGDHFVLRYVKDANHILKVFNQQGQYLHDIEFGKPGYIGFWPSVDDGDEAFIPLVGPHYPAEMYRVDVAKNTTEEVAHGGEHFKASAFEFQHKFYTSADGKRVPLFIVHCKDLQRDGSNPVFLYAYGAYGYSSFPWFSPSILTFVEMGGVYIHANVRGGGEYGETWHQDGIKTNKHKGVNDVIAAAEWAIQENYTSPKKIAMNGVSGGGPLATAAILQRPDLFGFGLINITMLDIIRFSHVSTGQAKIQEWGDVNNKDEFEAMIAFSPYHNVSSAKTYPPMYIQAGEKDAVTPPFHSYKFVAELQYAQKQNPNPMMLRIARGAGHENGTTKAEGIREYAEELYFLFKYLK